LFSRLAPDFVSQVFECFAHRELVVALGLDPSGSVSVLQLPRHEDPDRRVEPPRSVELGFDVVSSAAGSAGRERASPASLASAREIANCFA
jgi:hypothetical protein